MTTENNDSKAQATTPRHRARELAVQALYEWQLTQHELAELVEHVTEENGEQNVDQTYFEELLSETLARCEALDALIETALDRPFKALNPIELAVLRLACYELSERMEIPERVIINEAVELTKSFGSQDGHKYVNAVLDKLSKQLR